MVCLHIAAQAGEVPFTVAVADRDPGARLDGYEDVVEISFETVASELVVAGWDTDWRDDKVHRLPLPAGLALTACATTPKVTTRTGRKTATTCRYGLRHGKIPPC
ncbi:hypothetical protein ACFYUV_42395 [Nonomuraea sp. NPDC003560]|uniref:hypothetical protein n=1 Tax=Nonomuraea sp. NPDC003560 TaxID=3364341 RepID=UPI00367532A2